MRTAAMIENGLRRITVFNPKNEKIRRTTVKKVFLWVPRIYGTKKVGDRYGFTQSIPAIPWLYVEMSEGWIRRKMNPLINKERVIKRYC
ncbi:hypothetical protein IID22_03630 [Patescibacteria group bacterium]|nr:hypothetical protein [Patescibacteria group bacterium]